MNIISILLIILGISATVAGAFWHIQVTFEKGLIWGLSCLLIPLISFVFIVIYWKDVSRALFLWITGIFLTVGGSELGNNEMKSTAVLLALSAIFFLLFRRSLKKYSQEAAAPATY